jgi:hypothetical protein
MNSLECLRKFDCDERRGEPPRQLDRCVGHGEAVYTWPSGFCKAGGRSQGVRCLPPMSGQLHSVHSHPGFINASKIHLRARHHLRPDSLAGFRREQSGRETAGHKTRTLPQGLVEGARHG